ncbi:MAG: hypothetical protein ABW007_24460 [Chitinophagaceae bacterium]
MFRSYHKTAFRRLWKNKRFSFINIAGLGVGIAVCLVILPILQFEPVAGVSAASIALLTLSVKAVRAALANPVRSLRSE